MLVAKVFLWEETPVGTSLGGYVLSESTSLHRQGYSGCDSRPEPLPGGQASWSSSFHLPLSSGPVKRPSRTAPNGSISQMGKQTLWEQSRNPNPGDVAHFFYLTASFSPAWGLPGPMFVQTATWARSSFDIIYNGLLL